MLLLSWVKKLTGFGAWAGTATIVVGLVVAFSAAATWLREDAANDCDARWKLELSNLRAGALAAEAKQNRRIAELESKLGTKLSELEAVEKVKDDALDKQANSIPLSEACNVCRIPNESIWLREQPRGATAPTLRTGVSEDRSKAGGVAEKATVHRSGGEAIRGGGAK